MSLGVGVLASGEGSNLQAILDRLHGHDGVQVVGVGSDKPQARALARAQAAGVATHAFPVSAFADRTARDVAMADWLEAAGASLVVLAGYMQLVTPEFLGRFPDRVVNVHPALLPAFPGLQAIEQGLAYGVKVFGVTVHLVDGGVDTGSILAQRAVELLDATEPEQVREALRPVEHELLCGAVLAFARDAVRRDRAHARRVIVG